MKFVFTEGYNVPARQALHVLSLTMLICLVLLGHRDAHAHVGSDEKMNNRYYKLSPMADRLRIAYTIFFGRQPGTIVRKQMDVDGDGQISDREKNTYRETLAREVFKSVFVERDGTRAEIRWSEVSMGMGDQSISGGPFSIDIIGSVCFEHTMVGQEHSIRFRETLRLPVPGETELHLDPAPGIIVTKSELRGKPIRASGERWTGGAGPAQDGFELKFIVENMDSAGIDTACEPSPPKSVSRLWLLLAVLLGCSLVGGAIWLKR